MVSKLIVNHFWMCARVNSRDRAMDLLTDEDTHAKDTYTWVPVGEKRSEVQNTLNFDFIFQNRPSRE